MTSNDRPIPSHPLPAQRILLVEDDEAHAEIVLRAFEDEGAAFQLTVATSLKAACALLAHSTFDLVISDLNLPDGRGIELLPSNPEELHAPFMLMTGQGSQQMAVQALKAGVLDYIIKSDATLTRMPALARQAIAEWAARLARQEAQKQIIQRKDELEALVQERTAELCRANDELENRVAERTAELYQTVVALEREIGERKRAEVKLAQITEMLECTGELAKIGGWSVDLPTMKLRWSRETFRISELETLEEPDLEGAINFYAPEARPVMLAAVQAAIATGTPYDLELPLITAKGNHRWVQSQGFADMQDGKAVRIYGTFQDITERKRADVALAKAEGSRLAVWQSSLDAIITMDELGNITDFNPAAEKMFGYPAADVVGQSLADKIIPPALREGHRRGMALLLATGQGPIMGRRIEISAMRSDGTEFPVELTVVSVAGAGHPLFLGTIRDITERGKLEDQLRHSQKMQAVGTLAAGIAHDFNNILAAILGNTELALGDTAPEHPARESLDEIKIASARAKGLVQQILAFSSQQPRERHPMALGPLVEEAARLLRATIPAAVQIVTSVEADVPPVLADATQVHQVLVNLCTNAWHALGDQAGRIEVKLRSVTLDAAAASRLAGVRPGRFACLSVSDNGQGMDAATIQRIFDPFFTTKEPGKGTGLGLSVVHGIIKGYQGAIEVVSQPGQGTTITLYIPATVSAPGVSASSSRRGESQRILYLDDDEAVLLAATRMLEHLGYHVTGFSRAADAVKAFRDNPGQFDLAITDLNVPGTTGLKVAIELLKVRADLPVVLVSGSIDEGLQRAAREAGIRGILGKPFTMAEFSGAIHRLATTIQQL